MSKPKGLIVVLSSPSGGGKTTVINRIIEQNPKEFSYSVSMTTRPKRLGEIDGKDYWFVTPEQFQQNIDAGNLIEYERVHDWFYGTPKSTLETLLKAGKVVLLDLDVFGALELKRQFGDNAIVIFLQPPNEKLLIERLKGRATETPQQIERRLERLPQELAKSQEFDEIVVNDRLEETVARVTELIREKRKLIETEASI